LNVYAEQTANHENSASPKLAVLSNDEVAYPFIGGRFRFITVAGSETDYALFGRKVPEGQQLFVSDISITTIVLGKAIGTEPTVLDWALGLNSSGESLATPCEPPHSYAPRLMPLGMMSFLAQAPAGTWGQDIAFRFETPLEVESGRWFHVIVQIPVGVAVATQQLRGDVFVNHRFG